MICLVNLENIFMLYYGDILTAGSLAWIASAISVTMVSRLILNLHDAASADVLVSTTDVGLLSFQQISNDTGVSLRRDLATVHV
ncbi:hypothetical protein B0H12DRAFT_406485 [Mycena haematopus]|nr:hypothetical protein B0H12DRAFT_406485 [Mycena haematopus]